MTGRATKRKTEQWRNPTTGEVRWVLAPAEARLGEPYMATMLAACERLGDMALPGRTFRVLFKLLARLDFDNWIMVNQSELAKEMEWPRQEVCRAIHKLMENKILLPGPAGTRTYRLNPEIGWRGSAKGRVIALAEARKRQ